jgi:copper chaperone CopZ
MAKNTKTYKISGMDCPSCAMLIESEMEDAGINCKCSYAKQTLEIADLVKHDPNNISKIINSLGYKIEK